MPLYNQNLLFLKNNAPAIFEKVVKEVPLYKEISVEYLKDDIIVANETTRCYIQSTYNIEQEMRWTFKEVPSDVKTIMIFGIGMLDTLSHILNHFKQVKTIIFIEPSLQIFDAMLHKLDLVKILKKARNIELIFTINFSPAAAANDAAKILHCKDSYVIATLVSYQSLFQQYNEEFIKCFRDLIIRENITLGNSEISRYQWLTESMLNRNLRAPSVDIFRKVIAGKPVILVGAGPSLKNNMHLLKEAENKAIIIAGGTAVKILNQAGIRAHFYMILDSSDTEIYDNLAYPDVPLLFSYQASHEVLNRYGGFKAFYLTFLDALNAYTYEKASLSYTVFRTGPSVINTIQDIAGKFQASQIIFLGQDMCFYDDKMYADSSIKASDMLRQGRRFTLKDVYGKTVTSNYSYYSIKDSIETICKIYPNIVTVNATEGGLNIEGVENVKFADVLAELQDLPQLPQVQIEEVIYNTLKSSYISPHEVYRQTYLMDEAREIRKNIAFTKRLVDELVDLVNHRAQEKRLAKKAEQILKQETKWLKNPFYSNVIFEFCYLKFTILNNRYGDIIKGKDAREKAMAVIAETNGKIETIESYLALILLE